MRKFSRLISKLKFASPEKNDIVILHQPDFWIKEFVLKEIASTTLGVYPESIFVTPALLVRTLFRFNLINWKDIRRNWSFRYLLRKIYQIYIFACIEHTNAKVVVTSIDNSVFFQNISRLDSQRLYFAIQNGARTTACVRDSLPPSPHPDAVISMPHFFCFGERDIDLFSRHGHIIDNYHPTGSLIGGYYKSKISPAGVTPQFDLCLISQWHEHFFQEIKGDTFSDCEARRVASGINALNSFLRRLVEDTGLRLVICPRSHGAEISFYNKIFGDNAHIAIPDRRDFSTYRMIEQSRLAIALNSTTLSEVFAWGKKVLWCNVTDDAHYEMPEAGICYFSGDDYPAFKERVLMLLSMHREEYENSTREMSQYINRYDPSCPPHEIIRAAIVKALSNSNRDRF